MALRILRAEEPIIVSQLVIVVYGPPGIGKSTLGFSAEAPLTLDFDKGVYRAANRKDSVPVQTWKDVVDITPDDLLSYQTIIVDTAGRALDFLTADIIRRNPKMGRGGALTLQGYGALKGEFTAWLTSLKLIGKDVILIAHSSEEKNGDDLIERLDVQGGSKGEIYKSADAMGRLYLVNGKRTLSFSPTDTAFGKNPGCMDALLVPDISMNPSFLGDITQAIKDKLNTLTEEQDKRKNIIADWMAKVDEAKTAEDFTKLVKEVKKSNGPTIPVIKGYIHNKATIAGLVFDKTKEVYQEATA